ncbi:hypothetical protein [Roseobacter weihaiensis]|nr:hypothetical protein [Roseobacter sp. H9]
MTLIRSIFDTWLPFGFGLAAFVLHVRFDIAPTVQGLVGVLF